MTDSNYIVVMGQISDIWRRLGALEGARPKAESDAAACSPAVEPQSLPRSPDREAIAKLKIGIKDRIDTWMNSGVKREITNTLITELNLIIQWLDELDQGLVAKEIDEGLESAVDDMHLRQCR